MTHYDDEALCTLSQIKVHGTTVIASFQEEVKISEATMRDMLSQLNLELSHDRNFFDHEKKFFLVLFFFLIKSFSLYYIKINI
jgi:hypothetical protein